MEKYQGVKFQYNQSQTTFSYDQRLPESESLGVSLFSAWAWLQCMPMALTAIIPTGPVIHPLLSLNRQ